jgi:hypothetical protein
MHTHNTGKGLRTTVRMTQVRAVTGVSRHCLMKGSSMAVAAAVLLAAGVVWVGWGCGCGCGMGRCLLVAWAWIAAACNNGRVGSDRFSRPASPQAAISIDLPWLPAAARCVYASNQGASVEFRQASKSISNGRASLRDFWRVSVQATSISRPNQHHHTHSTRSTTQS